MTYKTNSKFGKKIQSVTVNTNDPENNTLQLKITIDVLTKLVVDPYRIYFGKLRKGVQSEEKDAALNGTDKDITKIISVTSQNKYIKAEVSPSATEGKNNKQQIKVTILPNMKVGVFNEWITIHTDHKEKKELKFLVSGEILGDISVLPPNINFGLFKKGGKYDKNIRLTAAPGVVFNVLGVKCATPELTAKVRTLKDGLDYFVTVSLGESFDKNNLNGKIIITTDDKEQENIVVPVFGRAFN